MSFWALLLVAVNICLGIGLFILWARTKRRPQDDPRLTRGLQLLQSKISVIEDLSDRTEHQVEQLNRLMESKVKQIQQKIMEADVQIQKIEQSMQKSLEVADIFQDKIPHEEIIERNNMLKYVQAAQMAHQGVSVEDIVRAIDLPRGEVEFISKVNRDQLMFSEQDLPEWAKAKMSAEGSEGMTFEGQDEWAIQNPESLSNEVLPPPSDLSALFENPRQDYSSLQALGKEFRKACKDYDDQQVKVDPAPKANEPQTPSVLAQKARDVSQRIIETATQIIEPKSKVVETPPQDPPAIESPKSDSTQIRKVVFPRVDVTKNLG